MATQITTETGIKGEQAAPLTPKGEQTRAHILETALRLFTEKGFQAATMREIAAAAGCSLGLTYRYFSRKEEMVAALYLRCAHELEEQVASLPRTTIAERYAAALEGDMARLAPFREALGTLFGVALVPDSELAVLSENMQELRTQVWGVFRKVVTEASDAPNPRQADDLATVFYAGYLSFLLFWLQDRTPEQRTTHELLAYGRDLLAKFRPALRLPLAGKQLARLVKIIGPMFGPMGKF